MPHVVVYKHNTHPTPSYPLMGLIIILIKTTLL